MANELLDMAKREAAALRSALSKNPEFQKLQQVQKLIDTYETFEVESDKGLPETPYKEATAKSGQQTGPRPGSKTSLVDEVVTNDLRERGRRASSGDLLPVVQAAGISLGGSIPSKTLASFLTNSKRFNNVKGLGYGLVEWGDSNGPSSFPPVPESQEKRNEAPYERS
ncbi:hypothetical protein [Rhizobium leguminosarum]|uniref:hypothetical protein n=1 Tax=Rhizobium leguminosarum TaxID=384 RepID=UPI003F9834BB